MYLLLLPHLIHRYLSASAHRSVRCFIPSLFLSTNIHFSFGLGSSSSQSFQSSTKQWKLAAFCKATQNFLPLLLHSLSSRFCHKCFIHHCSCFCQLINLFITFGDETSQIASFFLFLSSCGVPSRVVLPPRCLFLPDHVVLPQKNSQVCISCSWLNTLFLIFS